MSPPPLDRLFDLAGFTSGYWDVDGIWHAPGDADRVALLAGLGFDAATPALIETTVARLETEAWRRPLPPSLVVAAGQGFEIPVVLPEGQAADWRVDTEDGFHRTGRVGGAPGDEAGSLDGLQLHRHRLRLDGLAAGYHLLSVPALAARCHVIAVPPRAYLPPALARGGRIWGLSIQLYSVRSRRNWGIGDYTDLAALADLAGRAGADLIGINPLHARSLTRPEDCSPYSPISRLALDTLSIDVEAIAELAGAESLRAMIASAGFQARLATLRASTRIDYAGVTELKLSALRPLHEVFRREADPERRAAFLRFQEHSTPAIRAYAEYEALQAWHGPALSSPDWPAEPKPDDPRLAPEIEFQLWLQFVADEQLTAAAEAARRAGMRIGLYGDLAVGPGRHSAEDWAAPGLMARLSVGAPPDPLGKEGQNWNMPAPDPRSLEAVGYAPLTALLRANMRHAGALRIDHAMALLRLFVMPIGRTGEAGTYLRYPFEAMAGIVALESNRAGCVVIGEDLGTVPAGFRPAMAARNLLAYKVLAFERYPDGAFRSPADYDFLALATAATHDLPPLAGYWRGTDIAIRQSLGGAEDASQFRDRIAERHRLMVLFDWQKVMPDPPPDPQAPETAIDGVVAAQHRLIARSGSAIAMVQLADILGETVPVNLPGTYREYPNWRVRLSADLEDEAFQRRFAAAAAIMAEERPR